MSKSHLGHTFYYEVIKHFYSEEEQAIKQKQAVDLMIAERNKIYQDITFKNQPTSIQPYMFDSMYETLNMYYNQTLY
jgi:hypothetical protein